MPNLYKSVGSAGLGYPDIGQTYYLVDTDFRTAAQGWSQADRTGPLDLWNEKNPGRVFYASGASSGTGVGGQYSTDALAFTAAMNAMADYRGDTLFICPGNINIATAVTWDVLYGRISGRPTRSPQQGVSPAVRNTTLTLGVANALTLGASATGLEISYLRLVPLTAATGILSNAGVADIYAHNFLWDTIGIATSAATVLFSVTTTAVNRWHLDNFTWLSDAPQGPVVLSVVGMTYLQLSNFVHIHGDTGGDYVTSLLDLSTGATVSDAILIGPGRGVVGVVGAGTVTQLVNSVVLTGTGSNLITGFMGGLNYATAATLSTDTADFVLTENYFSTNGGVLYTS